jgi:hypothetical protein
MLLELLKLECAKEVEAGGTGGLRLQAKMLVKQLRELMEPGDFSSNPLLQAHLCVPNRNVYRSAFVSEIGTSTNPYAINLPLSE